MKSQWFWQPDVTWLNAVNMTNVRSLNAVRGFLYTGVIWGACYLASVVTGLRSIWLCRPGEKELSCSGALTAADKAFSFADGSLTTWAILVGTMAGFAVGGALGKRLTDTEYVERKEKAKRPPQVITSEGGPVVASQTQTTEEPVVTAERPAPRASPLRSAPPDPKAATEPDAYTDDERGEG